MDRITKLKEMLEQSPEDSFLMHALALEYVKSGKDTDAIALFQNILSADPDYVGSYYHLGKCHERRGEEAQAIQVYKTGIDVARRVGDAHAANELRMAWEDLDDDF